MLHLAWCKCRHTRDITSNNQRLDGIRSLVCKHGLDIGMVPRNMVIQQDAIATEHFAGIGNDFTGQPGVIHFGERGHGIRHLAFLLELAETQAQ